MHLAASCFRLLGLLRSLNQPIPTAKSTALVVADVFLSVVATAIPDHLSGERYVSNSYQACSQLIQSSGSAQVYR